MRETSMRADFITLTPEFAQELVATHNALPEDLFKNRPVQPEKVKTLSSQILDGTWDDNAETVKISKMGYILDGRHRVYACIMSGKSIPILYVTGVEEEVFKSIDTGKHRSAGDTFATKSIKNHTNMASIVKRLVGHSKGRTSTASTTGIRFTNEDALEVYYSNEDLLREVFQRIQYYYSNGQHILTVTNGSAVAMALILMGENREMVYNYFEEIFTGFCESPVIQSNAGTNVRNRMITGNISPETKMSPSKVGDMLFHSYELYKSGSKAKRYRVTGAAEGLKIPTFFLAGYRG